MIALILAAQSFLNDTHNARLTQDGIPGPRTETAMRAAASFVRRGVAGCIPHEWGQVSTYGGPTDWGDLYEGQSFFPIADPDGSGPKPAMYTPRDYYSRIVPDTLRGYLNPEMGTLDAWPKLKGKAVGVSYFLNPDEPGEVMTDYPTGEYSEPVYYCAARLSGELLAKARRGEPVYLRLYNPAIVEGGVVRSVLLRVIDWGPIRLWSQALCEAAGKPAGIVPGVTPWRFKLDIAPGAYRAVGFRTGADIGWWEVL